MKPRVKAQLHSSSGRSSKIIRDHTQIETVVEVEGVGRLVLDVDSAGGYSLRAYPEGSEDPSRDLLASERLPSMLGPSGVTPLGTRKSPNLQPVIGLHSSKAAQRSSPASPSSGPPRATTRRMRFLMYPSPPLPSKEGGPRQSHRVT